jgi:hypothetical protein
MSELLLKDNNAVSGLIQRLSKCPRVMQYGADEPETLVHAFADLEESFHKFLDEQLPKVLDSSVKGEALEDVLGDIMEEFRHILYHIHDPKFFRLVEPTHEWLTVAEEKLGSR